MRPRSLASTFFGAFLVPVRGGTVFFFLFFLFLGGLLRGGAWSRVGPAPLEAKAAALEVAAGGDSDVSLQPATV